MQNTEVTGKNTKATLTAIVMFAMYASFGMSWMGVVPLFQDIEKDLAIGHSQGAWLISIISLAKSIFPIIAGILATRIGLTKTLRISSILILFSLFTPYLPSYYAWLLFRFIFGIGGAMWVTLMGAVTMQIFEPKKRPLINSLNGVAVNFGVVIAFWYTLTLSANFGWKMSLTLYSAISVISAIVLFSLGELVAKSEKIEQKNQQVQPTEESMSYLGTLKLPVTWIISLSFTGPLALYLVFNTWLPVYYQEAMAIPKLQTFNYMVLMNAWGIPAAIFTGLMIQKFKRCKPFILVASILLPLASFYSVTSTDPASLGSLLALAGAGMFLSVSPLVTLLQNQPKMNPKIIGMILGTMFSVTYIISSMMPGMVGHFYDLHYDLKTLLSICCIITISPAIALVLKENK